MEGMKGGGDDDMGDGMRCSAHPYGNNPGGICAFCLQEKLGKLVSSSFPLPIHPSSSSSSPPSFPSDIPSSSSSSLPPSSSSLSFSSRPVSSIKTDTRRARLPFLLAKKNKALSSSSSNSSDIILKRSKSSATPRRGKLLNDVEDDNDNDIVIGSFSPRKRNSFWSFLYHPSKSSSSAKKQYAKSPRMSTISPAIAGPSCVKQKEKIMCSNLGKKIDIGMVEDESPNSQTIVNTSSSLERKVSRSRSVGCGSRSFSGDFFERISTGFGDCTLRRVESQREGKSKAVTTTSSSVINHHNHHQCMKERVKCAGIFSGLVMTSSSSSSSSSSYWLSSSSVEDHLNGKSAAVAISHGRARSWGWALASPMRAFSTKSKRDIIRDASDHNKNGTNQQKPNLSDIPSLLAVGVHT